MNSINNGEYLTKNKYGDYLEFINEYINKLYGKSLDLYATRYTGNNSTGTPRIDINILEDSLGYVDDYLYYFYNQLKEEDFQSIFLNLINNLVAISVLPPHKRGIYGQYNDTEKILYINPQLYSNHNLSSDERTRLYICHELGHIQNSVWLNNAFSFINSINCIYEEKKLIYDGFSLLDEATTQDRAEEITYYYSSKKRPKMIIKKTQLFDKQPYETNFDYYGEFQTPTIDFARTLRGIGKLENNNLAMNKFDKMALNENFAKNIIDEYIADNHINSLYYLLVQLGIIKNASYAAFGYADKKYLDQSYEALKKYNKLVVKMRDFRDPRKEKNIKI